MRNIFLLLVTFLLSSCIQYYDMKGVNPILMQVTQETYDNNVKQGVVYDKGESCVTNVLGLIATGDSSIEAARLRGNIEKISSVSTSYMRFSFYVPIFQKGCTIVHGKVSKGDVYSSFDSQ